MATKKITKGNPLSSDDGVTIPRIALREQGFIGLKTSNGRIYSEANAAFQYPQFIRTVNEIRHSPTVGGAMNVYRMMMSRVNWRVEPPESPSETDKARAAALESMMSDMDHSWRAFIEEVIPYIEYGFDVHEKVLRRRLPANGSKFSDGLVGIRKLAPRNQETIEKWNFSDDGADLLSVEQNIQNVDNSYRFANRKNANGLVPLEREKFLLFSASANKGNPQGNSIYKAIYLAYKQLTLLQDQELLGVSKDIQGMLKIVIPPNYLSPVASDSEKATAAAFQAIIDNSNNGTLRGLLVPGMIDPESKLPMFTYELMESKGSAKYDVEAIIKRLQMDILSALSVDVLKMGTDGAGSFSLAESKSSILALAIDYRLREIAEVLNFDLIPTIYKANGWSQDKLPKFVYEEIEDVDIESFSKAIQRIFSTSAIECDREVFNRIRKVIGVSPLPEDEPIDKDKLPSTLSGASSKSGAGMEVGTSGNGTAKSGGSGQDSSSNNNDNKG